MKKIYELAIIGGGPAGITFYNRVLKGSRINREDIILFEKGSSLCEDLTTYGRFVRNFGDLNHTKWDFIVDGKVNGNEVAKYFSDKFSGNVCHMQVTKIFKNAEDIFVLYTDEKQFLANHVVLATGVHLKSIESLAIKGKIFNITGKHDGSVFKIDFNAYEVIFVGSGDMVLFYANELARFIASSMTELRYSPITVLLKQEISKKANPILVKDFLKYSSMGYINVVKNHWQITGYKTKANGRIDIITSNTGEYKTKAPGGAYLGVYVGYMAQHPDLINCRVTDLVCIGDLACYLEGSEINISSALLDATRKAEFFQETV